MDCIAEPKNDRRMWHQFSACGHEMASAPQAIKPRVAGVGRD